MVNDGIQPFKGQQVNNLFSKEFLRNQLYEQLRQASKVGKDKVKSVINQISLHRALHEKFFVNKSALSFCQLG
jgi:hypothetical protein